MCLIYLINLFYVLCNQIQKLTNVNLIPRVLLERELKSVGTKLTLFRHIYISFESESFREGKQPTSVNKSQQ